MRLWNRRGIADKPIFNCVYELEILNDYGQKLEHIGGNLLRPLLGIQDNAAILPLAMRKGTKVP